MIRMTLVCKIRPEKQEEFVQLIRSLNSDLELQEGFRKSTLYQETDDKVGFSVIYEWETQEDCERFLCEENFRVLLGALKVLCEKSEIRYSSLLEGGELKH